MTELINYDNFFKKFSKKVNCGNKSNTSLDNELLNNVSNTLGGYCFNDGIFIAYSSEEILKHTIMVEKAFPNAKDKIYCFGRDWLNRQFAILKDESGGVLLFDISFDEILDLEMDLISFFENELIEYTNDILAEDFFTLWNNQSNMVVNCDKCVGYKVLPVLGGEDEIENLELVDADWSFEMNTILLEKIRSLDENEKIGNIEIQ